MFKQYGIVQEWPIGQYYICAQLCDTAEELKEIKEEDEFNYPERKFLIVKIEEVQS